MNPQVQQAIDNINAYIVENHNNEITANVLKPILIELANLFDLVGDLSDLNTADNNSIVDAINWVLNQISTGITIHSGQADPSVTPPVSYAVGDLYSRLDILENPYKIYIYNGAEWAEIRQVINDGVIGLDTTWSSEKISEAIQGDRFENLPTIDLVGNEITISNASWWIQGVNYNLSPAFEDTINYTTVAGMMRKDIIVAVTGNSMIRIQGAESDTNPLEPTVPPNTLLVTSIDVFHDSIGEPTEPIVGNNYVTKSSQGWVGYQININSTQVAPTLAANHSIAFRAFANGHSIIGLNITSYVPDKIWSGATIGIRNDSDFPITLKHLYVSSSKIRFSFPSGQDLILTKEMGVKYFKLSTIPTTGPAYAYCLNDFVAGVSLTLEQARQNGNVLEGDVEISANTNFHIFQENENYHKYISFNDDQSFVISITDKNVGDTSLLEFATEHFRVYGDSPTFKGITGNEELDKQGDRKAFAQISDLEDALEDYIQEPSTDGTSGQVLTTDGSGGRSWTTVSGEPTADQVSYDNTASGLLAETVQEAVDELNEVKINSSDILDVNDKIKVELLPNSVMTLEGNWDASTNTPTLTDGTGNAGDVYEVTVEGTVDFGNGNISFGVGDFVVYGANGKWYRSPNTFPTKEVVTVSSNLTLNATHNGKTLRFTDDLTVTVPAGLDVNFEVFLDNDTVSNNVTFDMSSITTVLAPSGNILVGAGTGYLTMTTATKVSLKGDFID